MISLQIVPINDESKDQTNPENLIVSHVIEKQSFTSESYSLLWKSFIQSFPKEAKLPSLSSSTFWPDFLSECLQWLCIEGKTSWITLLLHEQFPQGNELLQFLAEYFLTRTAEQEVILKYLFKHCQTTEYTNLSIMIFTFSLHSSTRAIRSITMKIFQTKFKTSTNVFDALIESIKHHQNEILTDSEYICYLIAQLIQTIKLNEKKKRKLNPENSSLIHQLKSTIDENPKLKQQLHIQLLSLFKQCKHWSILDEYRQDLEHLLQQPEQNLLIEENRIFVENIFQHFDLETLIHEQSACFEMILQILRRSIKKSKALPTVDLIILTLKQVDRLIDYPAFFILLFSSPRKCSHHFQQSSINKCN